MSGVEITLEICIRGFVCVETF